MGSFLLLSLLSVVASSWSACSSGLNCETAEDQVILLQASARTDVAEQHGQKLQMSDSGKRTNVTRVAAPLNVFGSETRPSPVSLLHINASVHAAGSSTASYRHIMPVPVSQMQLGLTILGVVAALLGLKLFFPGSATIKVLSLGSIYIVCSAAMIESNKWLMLADHFPYPIAMTTNHMFTSLILANCLRFACPSAFPSLEKLEVNWRFLLKFVPIGAAFALSIVCGNGAYRYLSVSFLQCMKQWNVALIYFFSVLFGLEALRRCSIILLAGTLCGTFMAIQGELHFQLLGFTLQVVSSLSEATKVIIQSILMSGSLKLDPLSMVLFMAPACLLANLIPVAVVEGPRIDEVSERFMLFLPFVLCNACLAFALNVVVAQCIKQLSAVGYLLCGIVKDICIIVTSAVFLGESLEPVQIVGFCFALSGVGAYSLYKQNMDCFDDDSIISGFTRVAKKLTQKDAAAEVSKIAK
jgi:hypothetical protein